MEGVATLRLAPTVHAPALARGAVARLANDLQPEEAHALRLLVSELVTNSVRHAELSPDQWIELLIDLRPEAIHVSVSDPGGGFARLTPPEHRDTGGWGLFLVQRMADRWGIDADGRTAVWFEMRRTG
jgi:anti-sigma regulatory factor (Ser/Thr protein kinase)